MPDATQQKKRGVALASGGLALALAVVAALKLAGVSRITWPEWWIALGLTVLVQGALLLVPVSGADARLRFDRRFLYLPTLSAALLLNFYIYLAPEARLLGLMAWLVALLFLAGLAGFMAVALLSLAMATLYALVVGLHYVRGAPYFLPYEIAVFAAFLVIVLYSGIVYERLRRDRVDSHRMRRELAELAATDSLTGLPNRRVFEGYLRAEVARLQRYGGTCTIAMIDVDHFKVYNDTHGHMAGDEILKALADLMREKMRTTDIVARFGGEEFTVLMVNTPRDVALQAIDRLRAVVEAYPFEGERVMPGGRLTISAGLASYPEDGRDSGSLLGQADTALYAAKRRGRNRVESAA